jgi:uncharacterized membrane protein
VNRANNTDAARRIERYLNDLKAAARLLPAARRKELVEDVRSHIQVALAESGRDDAEAVSAVLEALGSPREIVAASLAGDVEPAQADGGIGGLEITALVLLLICAAAAGVGWLVGVLLLWASPRWTTREKLLGTLVLPGGVVLPIVVASGLATNAVFVPLLLLAVGLAAPILTAVYLFRSARAVTVIGAAPRWGVGVWAVLATVVILPAIGGLFFLGTSQQVVSNTPVVVSTSPVMPTHSAS